MNYADDRLDRRGRSNQQQQQDGLWAEFTLCLSTLRSCENTDRNEKKDIQQANELLGRCLRDLGWNRHAVYHFAVAWMLDPANAERAGDYAQMTEFAGFPEVGALALLQYFQMMQGLRQGANYVSLKEPSLSIENDDWKSQELDPSWLQQSASPKGHCGCGSIDCGSHECFLPFEIDQLQSTMDALARYLQIYQNGVSNSSFPSANIILGIMAKNALHQASRPVVDFHHHPNMEETVAFWNSGKPYPLLQILLLKLLYPLLPSLAASAVVELQQQSSFENNKYQLSTSHKSHWAYYVLIRSVVLGERIKPHRRSTLPAYHIPVWDILWNTDGDGTSSSSSKLSHNSTEDVAAPSDSLRQDGDRSVANAHQSNLPWLTQLRRCLQFVSTRMDDLHEHPPVSVPLSWALPPGSQQTPCASPLFVIGDSHVFSLAWQTVLLRYHQQKQELQRRQFVPIVITGLKAFHLRPGTRFFTHSNLHTSLQRLQSYYDAERNNSHHRGFTALFSAGEIDCREGIGGPELLEGYCRLQDEHMMEQLALLIQDNVEQYIEALNILRQSYSCLQQILVMPVAPHAQRTGGKVVGRGVRRQITHMWNESLRNILLTTQSSSMTSTKGIYLLDYEPLLRMADADSPVGYVLNPIYNADHTHLNSAFLPLLQNAIKECGCDWNLL